MDYVTIEQTKTSFLTKYDNFLSVFWFMKVNRGYNPLSFKLTFYTLFALLLLRGFR